MKTLKVSLLALVFTVGIGGAVVQKIQAAPKLFETNYNWDGNGPSKSGSDLNRTITQARADYGCSGTTSVCAEGTPTSGSGPHAFIYLQ